MFKTITLQFLKFYKKRISPFLVSIFGQACRFSPTCSEYTFQAVDKYGVIKGGIKSIVRIVRCNPLSRPGYDPLT